MVTTVVKTIAPTSADYTDDIAWAAAGPKDCTVNLNLTALSGATTSVIPLDSTASATTGAYVGNTMTIGSETRLITAYNATTKTATVGSLNGSAAAFSSAPASGAAVNIGQVIWQGQMLKTRVPRSTTNTISGKTTSATCYYELTTAPNASIFDSTTPDATPLRLDTSYAYIDITSGATLGIDVQVDYFRFSKIQMKYSGSATAGIALFKSAVGSVANNSVDRAIFEGTCNNSGLRGVLYMAGGTLTNSLVENTSQGDSAAIIARIDSAVKVYNTTFAATGGTKLANGLQCTYVGSTFKNVAVMGCSAVSTDALSHVVVKGYTDGVQSGWTTIAYDNTVYAKVASDGTHDFRLTAASPLKDVGQTLTGAELTYTANDAYGRARPAGAAWDIGPYEYLPPAASPVAFSGTIPNRTGAVGSAASFTNSTFFTGSATPFTYSLQAGTLPAGLSLNTSTGAISGTPTTVETKTGIVIRATDANSATADSNSFSITISASNAAPTFPGAIANISGKSGVALTPVSVASQFSDTDTLTYSASPLGVAWPSGLVVNSGTGVISGTVSTIATTSGLKVRATDTAGQTVDSNAFTLTITAATGSFKMGPLVNNAGQLVAAGTTIVWEWRQSRIGTVGTVTPGSSLANSDSTVDLTNIPLGAGAGTAAVLGADWASDIVAYQPGTSA
jgi:hypothetical protein